MYFNHSTRMESILPKLFTTFGISLVHGPMTLQRKIIFLVNILISVYILIYQLRHHSYLYQHDNVIGQVTDMFQTMLPTSFHLFILAQTALKSKAQKNLHVVLKKIYRDLYNISKASDMHVALRWKYFKNFIVMNMVCLTSEFIVLYLVHDDDGPWKVTIRLKTFALIVIRLNDFQFMFYVFQLNIALEQIKLHLSQKNRDILLIKHISIDIWRASDLLNKRFGISIFCTVFSNFIVCLMSFYWIMYNVYNDRYFAVWYAVASVLFITSPIINLNVLYYVCEQCIQQVSFTVTFFS